MGKEALNQDDLITAELKKNRLAALYISVGINVLRQVVDQQDDDSVCGLFGRLIPAGQIRRCVRDLDRVLNPEPQPEQLLP